MYRFTPEPASRPDDDALRSVDIRTKKTRLFIDHSVSVRDSTLYCSLQPRLYVLNRSETQGRMSLALTWEIVRHTPLRLSPTSVYTLGHIHRWFCCRTKLHAAFAALIAIPLVRARTDVPRAAGIIDGEPCGTLLSVLWFAWYHKLIVLPLAAQTVAYIRLNFAPLANTPLITI